MNVRQKKNQNNKMKSLIINFILIISIVNSSFGQAETSYDLTCITTPFYLDTPTNLSRIYCDNGVTTVDTFTAWSKNFYTEDNIGIYSAWHHYYDQDSMLQIKYGKINIITEPFFNQPETKTIEMDEASISIKFPTWYDANSVAFDIIDFTNEGILFHCEFLGVPTLYESISDLSQINDLVAVYVSGNRVYIEGELSGFHIGGDHVKVGNIVFNEPFDHSTSTSVIENPNLAVFPNPVQDILNINCKNIVTKNVRVFDTKGSLILNITQPKFSHQVNTNNWNSGVYFAEIELENGERYFQKVVKN